MGKFESNAEAIEPKYYIRYFLYEDFTRQRIRYRSAYWGDDEVIKSLQFGASFEMKMFHPEETEIELLTVANRPVLRSVEHPKKAGLVVEIYDVFFAPTEQWMLYKDATEEDINREPDLVDPTD